MAETVESEAVEAPISPTSPSNHQHDDDVGGDNSRKEEKGREDTSDQEEGSCYSEPVPLLR